MRRIVRSEAICLRVQDYHESSKLVTFFTLEHGKVSCLAKGARRLRSKFGAALDLFAQSRIIFYTRETRDLYTLSDAELVHCFNYSRLPTPDSLSRFLAAEQIAEFALRVIQPHDPSPQLYRLLLNYLSTLEQDSSARTLESSNPRPLDPYPMLVCSFLLKAASFLGFRPELRRCLICRRPVEGPHPAYFDAGRGGIVCSRCAGERPDITAKTGTVPRAERSEGLSPVFTTMTRLDPASLDTLAFLLYTPAAEIAQVLSAAPEPATGDNRQERQDAKGEREMTKCKQERSQDSGPGNLQSPIYNLESPPAISYSANLQSPIYNLQSPLALVLGFLGHHFDPLVLNSFHWHTRLERNS